MNWESFRASLLSTLVAATRKGIISLIIVVVSFRVIGWLCRRLESNLQKPHRGKSPDKTVTRSLINAGGIGLKILVIVSVVGYLGVDTGSISALIASLGVGVGLAVNGTLSNVAGGALLLLTRPFRADDYIEALGYEGTVEEIRMCHTRLVTPDGKVIYLPNGALSTGNIVNLTEKKHRRLDLNVPVPIGTDYETVKNIVLGTARNNPMIFKHPEPTVRLAQTDLNGNALICKFWVNGEDYWTLYYDIREQIAGALRAADIPPAVVPEMIFMRRDV